MKRWPLSIATLLGLVFLLQACGPAEEATPTPAAKAVATTAPAAVPTPTNTPVPTPTPGPKRGGTIRAVNEAGIGALDGVFTAANSTRNVAVHMYETVVDYDATWAIRPQIADWQISADNTVYTFTIREGATFHDGKPVTAEDVLTSIDRFAKGESASGFFGIVMGQIAQREVLSDRVFRITFKRPVVTVLNAWGIPADRRPHVMPKEIAQTKHTEAVTTYIGSGPYKLKNWVKGDRVEMVRYEGYVARKEPSSGFAGRRNAYADEIHAFEVPDQTTRVAGLEAGQFDYVQIVANDFYARLKGNKDIGVYIQKPGLRPGAYFNHENPPTDNAAIRRAIAASFDHEAALLAAAGNKDFYVLCGTLAWCADEPASGIKWQSITAGLELWNINDRAKAKQLAQAAGYKGEKILFPGSGDNPIYFGSAQVLVQNMRDAGFNVDLLAMDDAAVKQLRAAATGWNVLVTAGNWASAVPSRARSAPAAGGITRYKPSARMPELAELVHFETNPEKHLGWLNEIQALNYQEMAQYPLGYVAFMTPTRAWLKGYEAHPVMWLANAWLDK